MCSRFLVTVPAVLVSLTDVAKMEQRKSVEDLKDLESFEKKILKEGEKRTREEAKNYLRLLTIGAESIWAWWHPSCMTSEFLTILPKKDFADGGTMFPFGIVWPSGMAIDLVKLSQFIDYCKKRFGSDASIANGFIWRENGRMCYVWYLNAGMLNGLSELIKKAAKIYSLPITQESNQCHSLSEKSKRCKIVDLDKVV